MQLIQKYFPKLEPVQLEALKQLLPIYTEWNDKINVVSRKDIEHLYLHHVLHSLALAKVFNFTNGTQILDVGTGGGFPGIPLAILFPNCSFHLIDSIGKKITVVNEVAKALNLTNLTAQQTRVEHVKTKYDFIVSRAVTRFDKFYALTRKTVHSQQKNSFKNGILYLKGGDFNDELLPIKQYTIINISDYFEEPFFETKKIIHALV